jgi:hypothetical protein
MPDMKQLAPEHREGVARALAGAIGKLTQWGNYEGPFDVLLTVTLTDANGKVWTASVCDILPACSCVEVTAEK